MQGRIPFCLRPFYLIILVALRNISTQLLLDITDQHSLTRNAPISTRHLYIFAPLSQLTMHCIIYSALFGLAWTLLWTYISRWHQSSIYKALNTWTGLPMVLYRDEDGVDCKFFSIKKQFSRSY